MCFESQVLGLRYCWLIARQCSNGSLPVRQCAYCPPLCDPESCSRGRDVCESKRKIPQRKRMARRHPAWNKRWKYSAVSLFKPSRKTMTGKRIWEGTPVNIVIQELVIIWEAMIKLILMVALVGSNIKSESEK